MPKPNLDPNLSKTKAGLFHNIGGIHNHTSSRAEKCSYCTTVATVLAVHGFPLTACEEKALVPGEI